MDNIFRLIEPLYYDDLTLADVVITAIAERKENNKGEGGSKATYYIASFTYKIADAVTTATLKEYAQDRKIFRVETLTDIANIKSAYNFYNPFTAPPFEPEMLPQSN